MKAVTAAQMQEIDRITIERTGIPGEVLMGYAGKSIADYILSGPGNVKKTAVFCGTGNNGGDGFVIAYFLSNAGHKADVYLSGTKGNVSDTARVYLNVCLNSGVSITEVTDENQGSIDLEEYDLIVDALLGTGFKGSAKGVIKFLIERINNSGIKTLSVDIPSGLPPDGEAPAGAAVKADFTVTIGLPKISLVTYPGRVYTGVLHVADIGFPSSLTESDKLSVELVDADYAAGRLNLSEDPDTHKGRKGHILIIGGFDYMEGAALMAAGSAFETGAGLVTLLTTPRARSVIAGRIPELMTGSIVPDENWCYESKDEKDLIRDVENGLSLFLGSDRKYDVLIIGPGMGRSLLPRAVFNTVINSLDRHGIKKVLIDGDGLYHLAEYLKSGKISRNPECVITPHFLEASRLLDISVDQIKNSRLKHAVELSKRTGCIALLKGPSTIITDGSRTLINTSGNPSLAAAGSGDVLSGITGSLMLRQADILDAAGIGAYIHGLAGDLAINKYPCLKATDITEFIRDAINTLKCT